MKKKGEKETRNFGLGYHQSINDKAKGAVEFSHETISRRSKLKFASNYKFDEYTSLKSRLSIAGSKEMRVGFVLKQSVFPSTKITLTSDINSRLLWDNVKEGSGVGHQFGVSLSFFD